MLATFFFEFQFSLFPYLLYLSVVDLSIIIIAFIDNQFVHTKFNVGRILKFNFCICTKEKLNFENFRSRRMNNTIVGGFRKEKLVRYQIRVISLPKEQNRKFQSDARGLAFEFPIFPLGEHIIFHDCDVNKHFSSIFINKITPFYLFNEVT